MEQKQVKAIGFGKIIDIDTNEILQEFTNDINFENLSVCLALSAGNKPSGFIHELVLGNAGATVNAIGVLDFLQPNVSGENAALYNETYSKIVDNNSSLNTNPSLNRIEVTHTTNTFYSDIITICTLDYGEPSGQSAFDINTDTDGNFTFSELGLRTAGGRLISHAIFAPVLKSLNRSIQIQYTIRIVVA